MVKKVILIGISGGTGSGKTTVAKAISEEFGKPEVALIQLDSYYQNINHLSFEERAETNFDHPNAIDFSLLKSQLRKIMNGETINIPVYDFKTHTRKDETISVEAHHIVILEGIFALLDEEIRNMMDIKLFVDTDDDIRMIRRMKRDISKRKRSFESVIDQYYKTVRPMHIQYVEPTKLYADIIIPEGGKNLVAVDIIRTKIQSLLQENKGTEVELTA